MAFVGKTAYSTSPGSEEVLAPAELDARNGQAVRDNLSHDQRDIGEFVDPPWIEGFVPEPNRGEKVTDVSREPVVEEDIELSLTKADSCLVERRSPPTIACVC